MWGFSPTAEVVRGAWNVVVGLVVAQQLDIM